MRILPARGNGSRESTAEDRQILLEQHTDPILPLIGSERDRLLLPPTQGSHGSTTEVKKGFSIKPQVSSLGGRLSSGYLWFWQASFRLRWSCLGLLVLSKMVLPHQLADHKLSPSLSLWQASSTALQAPGREERSPRRCVRLLESCLGHQIPCCDPCATCYCRFFNAFCYCRKISTNFPCGKN